MDTTTRGGLPARLDGVRRRFERWRGTRKGHGRIPDSLWDAAALMAGRYGIPRTANALGVNYQALKKHLDRKTAAASRQKAAGESQFVELTPFAPVPPFAPSGACECLLEWEDAGGAKMRVRLQGVGMPDLVALGRSFWDRRS
jgi:hypothetical protein